MHTTRPMTLAALAALLLTAYPQQPRATPAPKHQSGKSRLR